MIVAILSVVVMGAAATWLTRAVVINREHTKIEQMRDLLRRVK